MVAKRMEQIDRKRTVLEPNDHLAQGLEMRDLLGLL